MILIFSKFLEKSCKIVPYPSYFLDENFKKLEELYIVTFQNLTFAVYKKRNPFNNNFAVFVLQKRFEKLA